MVTRRLLVVVFRAPRTRNLGQNYRQMRRRFAESLRATLVNSSRISPAAPFFFFFFLSTTSTTLGILFSDFWDASTELLDYNNFLLIHETVFLIHHREDSSHGVRLRIEYVFCGAANRLGSRGQRANRETPASRSRDKTSHGIFKVK